jgi:hypothetical protein
VSATNPKWHRTRRYIEYITTPRGSFLI